METRFDPINIYPDILELLEDTNVKRPLHLSDASYCINIYRLISGMNSGLLQNNVSTVVLHSTQSTIFGYELPIKNLIKNLNSQRPCYMPTDRQTDRRWQKQGDIMRLPGTSIVLSTT
jgi:hypothetical protein